MAVRMCDLLGVCQCGVPRTSGARRQTEEAQRVSKATQTDHLGILRIVKHMVARVLRQIAFGGLLEVCARGLELALPEGCDAEHVCALHEEHAASVTLAAAVERRAEAMCICELASSEAADRHRTKEW